MDQKEFASLGGKARALKLSKERRKEIAEKAAVSRWSKAVVFEGIQGSPKVALIKDKWFIEHQDPKKCAYCKNLGTSQRELFGELRWFCEDHMGSGTP